MSVSNFSGIENGLIKEFLLKSEVPVEIENPDREKRSLKILKFSVDKAENQNLLQRNLLKINVQSVVSSSSVEELKNLASSGKKQKINFYFNGLGLCFYSRILLFDGVFCISIPEKFYNINETQADGKRKVSAVLFYDFDSQTKKSAKKFLQIKCSADEKFDIFKKPSLDLKTQDKKGLDFKVRNWIENIVRKRNENYQNISLGNGLFLIPIGKYLFDDISAEIEPVQGRLKPPSVIYLDERRIVFASKKENMVLAEGKTYEIQLSFPLPPPLKPRIVNLFCTVSFFFEDYGRTRLCADALISEIKEEDKRFLSELIK